MNASGLHHGGVKTGPTTILKLEERRTEHHEVVYARVSDP